MDRPAAITDGEVDPDVDLPAGMGRGWGRMSRANCRVTLDDSSGGEGAVIVVEGDLDLASMPAFVGAISTAQDRGRSLVIDLSATSFIDSSGVAALVRAHGTQTAARAPLVLRAPSPSVMRVLNLAGLDQVLTVVEG
jgi:anti-anti-sigma factor